MDSLQETKIKWLIHAVADNLYNAEEIQKIVLANFDDLEEFCKDYTLIYTQIEPPAKRLDKIKYTVKCGYIVAMEATIEGEYTEVTESHESRILISEFIRCTLEDVPHYKTGNPYLTKTIRAFNRLKLDYFNGFKLLEK